MDLLCEYLWKDMEVLGGLLLALNTLKVSKVALTDPGALREVAGVARGTAADCPTPGSLIRTQKQNS